MNKSYMANNQTVVHQWYVVDAENIVLGRLSSEVASILRGKHKPTYTPNVDCGDYVIIVNADKITITGDQDHKKNYYSHSLYPGGLRTRSTKEMREKYPVEWVEKAVYGMLPHTSIGENMRRHLFVYTGSEHPHAAQKPVALEIKL